MRERVSEIISIRLCDKVLPSDAGELAGIGIFHPARIIEGIGAAKLAAAGDPIVDRCSSLRLFRVSGVGGDEENRNQ